MGRGPREAKAAARVHEELLSGEHLLWVGQPTVRRLTGYAVASAPSGALVVLLLIGFQYPSLVARAQQLLATRPGQLIVLAALTAGLLLLGVACWIWANWAALTTIYAVTDRRILTITFSSAQPVKWIGRRELTDVRLRLRRDGSGDVMFQRNPTDLERLVASGTEDEEGEDAETTLAAATAQTFFGIRDASEVLDLVRREFRLGGRS